MKPPVAMLLLALLSFAPFIHAEEFKPTVPLLELKPEGSRWSWQRHGAELKTGDLPGLLKNFAGYSDDKTGWPGLDEDGYSRNILVLHVDSHAPEAVLWWLLEKAREAGIEHYAIADSGEAKALPKDRAPASDDLDAAYLRINLGMTRNVIDAVTVKLEDSTSGHVFSASIGQNTRVVADRTAARAEDLIFSQDDTAAVREKKEALRRQVVDDLVRAIKLAMDLSDADADAIEIIKREVAPVPGKIDSMKRESNEPAAWVWYELAGRACATFYKPGNWPEAASMQVWWPFRLQRPGVGKVAPEEYRGTRHFMGRIKGKDEVRENEDRVLAALNWLRDHQKREGHWSATEFGADSTRGSAKKTGNAEFTKDCPADTGWEATCDIGLTGLALLAYAGIGADHKSGDYRATVRQAVIYLRRVQDNDGCFGDKEDDWFVYNHAICTLALAEIYGLSGDAVLKPIIDTAVDFILKCQNPGLGWRYGVQPGNNDSSVTCWMVMALHAAKKAGVEFDSTKAYSDADTWFKMVTVDVNGYPKCGYDSPGSNNARLRSTQEYEHNPTMDAMYVNAMLAMGKADTRDKTIKSLARGCVEEDAMPTWKREKIDFYYWYQASRAVFKVGGAGWDTWRVKGLKTICDHQRGYADVDEGRRLAQDLDEHGSWDPVGAWGTAGGRVYATAMGALCLETPWSEKE
ncbi:MAG: terpene cyclase/mutase family protein [Planctomycetes bacterium]|nr:terpene cyclase/mutase family protein [Planctomycetota bacterium]